MINQSCYCRYIIFIIIQHLYAGISQDIIRQPVHKAMHKENSRTFTKSTKDIKITNKILSQYYYNIFRSSFGYGILPCSKPLQYEPEFLNLFPKTGKRHFMLQNKQQSLLDPLLY